MLGAVVLDIDPRQPKMERRKFFLNPEQVERGQSSVVRPTLLYINSEAVIPAPYQVRGKLQRESRSEILDSGSSPE
jgi:hypothetical protein